MGGYPKSGSFWGLVENSEAPLRLANLQPDLAIWAGAGEQNLKVLSKQTWQLHALRNSEGCSVRRGDDGSRFVYLCLTHPHYLRRNSLSEVCFMQISASPTLLLGLASFLAVVAPECIAHPSSQGLLPAWPFHMRFTQIPAETCLPLIFLALDFLRPFSLRHADQAAFNHAHPAQNKVLDMIEPPVDSQLANHPATSKKLQTSSLITLD